MCLFGDEQEMFSGVSDERDADDCSDNEAQQRSNGPENENDELGDTPVPHFFVCHCARPRSVTHCHLSDCYYEILIYSSWNLTTLFTVEWLIIDKPSPLTGRRESHQKKKRNSATFTFLRLWLVVPDDGADVVEGD